MAEQPPSSSRSQYSQLELLNIGSRHGGRPPEGGAVLAGHGDAGASSSSAVHNTGVGGLGGPGVSASAGAAGAQTITYAVPGGHAGPSAGSIGNMWGGLPTAPHVDHAGALLSSGDLSVNVSSTGPGSSGLGSPETHFQLAALTTDPSFMDSVHASGDHDAPHEIAEGGGSLEAEISMG